MLNKLFGLRCPDCGKPISEDDSLCPHCGTNLDTPLGATAEDDPNIALQNLSTTKHHLEIAKQAYDANKNLKDALLNCDLAIQYSPNFAEAHNLRGLILDSMRQIDDAINSYREAIRLDPSLENAKSNLEDAETEVKQRQEKRKRRQEIIPKVIFGVVAVFTLACIVTAGVVLYKLLYPYFEPNISITLEPDYSLVSKVNPSDLDATVEMLTERCRILGYRISFTLAENNQIIASVPESIGIDTFVKRVIAIGLLEFVDFRKTSISPGTIIQTDFDYPYFPQADGLRWHTVMTNKEIIAVDVMESGSGRYDISFTLTPEGTDIFSEYTTNNVGSYLGIVLDKIVISSPMVNSPITGGTGVITGKFTQEEAEALAAYLRIGEPLPIPLVAKDVSVTDK